MAPAVANCAGRRHLPDQLLVDARDRDGLGLFVHGKADAVGRVNRHRVRIAQRHNQLLALHFRAVAHAFHHQRLGKALVDARHHVLDQGAGGAVQGAHRRRIGRARDHQIGAFHANGDRRHEGAAELAFRTFDFDRQPIDVDLHALGHGDGFSSNSRHLIPPGLRGQPAPPVRRAGCPAPLRLTYQTLQMTSPPTPNWRARAPVITPLGVDRMAIPIPDSTQGISFFCA